MLAQFPWLTAIIFLPLLALEMPLYAGLLIAFGVKLAIFPLHTWLPDAHGEASAPVSMILAGVLLKMGC